MGVIGIGGSPLPPIPPILFITENRLTEFELLKTIFFQVGIIGAGSLIGFVYVIPWLNSKMGLHAVTEGELKVIRANPVLRVWFKNVRKWFDHPILMLGGSLVWGVAFILLTGTLYILVTDIGWLDAWRTYMTDPDYIGFFLMARASGQPNGAHLPSYIAMALLGTFVAFKYRKGYFADAFQGIMVVGFAVAVHEGLWMFAYWGQYYGVLGLAEGANFIEDFFFFVMSLMLVYTFWKSPLRTIPLRTFAWPVIIYSTFLLVWFAIGLPITTVNNFQVGQGVFGVTRWFAVPWVNGIEIASWLLIAGSFAWVIRRA